MSCDPAMNTSPPTEAKSKAVVTLVDRSPTLLLARTLERQVMAELGLDRRAARRLIHDLVARCQLAYRVDLGHTFIGLAHDKPRRIGGRIVIVPQGQRWLPDPGEAVVTLQRGIAFGYGSHATTLLCLKGLAWLMPAGPSSQPAARSRLCDVGTGSGSLALAGLKLGVATALASDTDPCARYEARANAQLNDLSGRIAIRADALGQNDGQFDLILANLRWPTLSQIRRVFSECLKKGGALVVSGLRPEEAGQLVGAYQRLGLACVWQGECGDWSGVVFRYVDGMTGVLQNDPDR